ncbi:MAG: hypothetical protein QOJ57_871 [Thermoleophilaceae bacterium]|jgi:hypothetical protein|nr:hypothetical protein [Thermoleophilaceae bacterium]
MIRRGITAAVAVCALALPAVAQAEVHWQFVADPAPGATGLDGSVELPPRLNFTVAAGTPYLAEIGHKPNFELNVYRPVGNGTWRDLGNGSLNPPGRIAGGVDLTSVGSTAWIAWEEGATGVPAEVHVARLTRSGVRELPGSPIANAGLPQIAYFGGRVYVAYAGIDGMHAVRTRANGRGFERIESFDHTPAEPGELGVYRGRLYLSDFESGTTLYSLLNRRATGWVQVDDPPDDLFAQRIGDTTFALAGAGGEGPGAPSFVRVRATRRGVTHEIPSPAKPGNNVSSPHLLAADGTLWMAWVEGGPSDMAPPQIPHVARLVGGR